MADNQHENSQPKGKRRRRVWILLVFTLLVIFHRPILLGALHWFAVRSAAKQNLRLEFRAEGTNVLNHANFLNPNGTLNNAQFGRIQNSGPGRVMQFGLKYLF